MSEETAKVEDTDTDSTDNIKEVADLSDLKPVDPDETVDLFDIIIRRDTNFVKEGSDSEFNVDEDFKQFSVLCHSYAYANTQGLSQLITINPETIDEGLVKAASLMTGTLYANLVKYNKDGTVKDYEILKVFLLGVYPTFNATGSVVNKMFIFAVDSTFK